jgi:predicted ABC-type sugar transport system permease subunit
MLEKWCWMLGHGLYTTAVSLVAAVVTQNPNWVWNIPLGMLVGSLVGLVAWSIVQRVREM